MGSRHSTVRIEHVIQDDGDDLLCSLSVPAARQAVAAAINEGDSWLQRRSLEDFDTDPRTGLRFAEVPAWWPIAEHFKELNHAIIFSIAAFDKPTSAAKGKFALCWFQIRPCT